MPLRVKLIMGVVAAICALSDSTDLFAQDMPPKVEDKARAAAAAKERYDYMSGLGASEKILVAVMRGQAPLDAKAIAAVEKLYAAVDAKDILSHFNPGTGDDVVEATRARALIWNEWGKVTQVAAGVKPAVGEALAAAKAGDQKVFAEKEQAAVNACNACHRPYRAPRKQ